MAALGSTIHGPVLTTKIKSDILTDGNRWATKEVLRGDPGNGSCNLFDKTSI